MTLVTASGRSTRATRAHDGPGMRNGQGPEMAEGRKCRERGTDKNINSQQEGERGERNEIKETENNQQRTDEVDDRKRLRNINEVRKK